MKRSIRITLFIIVAGAATLTGYLTQKGMQPAAAKADASEALMAVRLPDLQGVEQGLEQWRGKVMVVNYWATWCPPCIKEIPEFSSVSRRYADQPVQFVGISIDDADKVKAFRDQYDVPYPLLIATLDALEITAELGNEAQALPFTLIVDPKGAIRHAKLGTLSESELEGKIDALLP
ncbi:MAG: TlpA family protein disulfide reductase [Rhodocyclales bacterium]|nr:TlpA family protein disulfide reductase [Rhodocyclales bacterium]